jgi:4-hydroxybenzoate polyprenyltransferase
MNLHKIKYIIRAARPNQWIKNLIIFTAIVFSGKLFDPNLFLRTAIGFFILCLLSSTSYILNDVIDYPYDKKHPFKKLRPVASGKLSIPDATFIVFIFSLISLIVSLSFSIAFSFIALMFLLLHFFYSLYFKKHPVLDIFAISFSFMLRAFSGQVLTGYHIQIWLLLTIFFISLFIASVKRHAELVLHGKETRPTLSFYKGHLLDFLTTTFATLTIVSYSLYTFLEKPPLIKTEVSQYFSSFLPGLEARKWFMITIPLVVYGISRYAQLLYEREEGESPEKIITQDKPLIFTILFWGAIVVVLIYAF